MKRYWVCSLLGHRNDDPEAIYDIFVCGRCGDCEYNQDYSEPWHILLYWRMKYRAIGMWTRVKFWCRPCVDCGRRFGRHNESVEHMPF